MTEQAVKTRPVARPYNPQTSRFAREKDACEILQVGRTTCKKLGEKYNAIIHLGTSTRAIRYDVQKIIDGLTGADDETQN
jgi:hypothetical protein